MPLRIAAGIGLLLILAVTGCNGLRPMHAVPVVTIARATDAFTAGNSLAFEVRAEPAPREPLTVSVTVEADSCELPDSLESVTIAAGDSQATLEVQTTVGMDRCTVSVMIAPGDGYQVGDATEASASATVTVTDNDGLPAVSIAPAAGTAEVTEGTPVSFTLIAMPAPTSPVTVTVSWTQSGSFLTASPPETETITIPTTGTATLSADTDDDSTVETNGSVTVTVGSGSGYTVGSPSSATVTVTDNDGPPTVSGPIVSGPIVSGPAVSIAAGPTPVTEGTEVSFTLTATPAPTSPVTVNVIWSQSGSFLTASPPETETITIPTTGTATLSADTDDDSTDEANGSVTATVATGSGYTVGTPSSATVTVNDNDDPGPRTLTRTGGRTLTWGSTDGPLADGAPTRVFLNDITDDNRFFLKVDRGSSSSCTMTIDPTHNPGSVDDNVPMGSMRLRTPGNSGFSTYNSLLTVEFDSNSDRVEAAPANGPAIVLDVTVSCLPVVSIAAEAGTPEVTEGTSVSFTLTAAPAPTSPVTVTVSWTESGSFLTASQPETITIPTTGTVTLSADTENDLTDEANGSVTATVDSGSGYTVGTPNSATVTVNDNDGPAVSIAAVTTPVTEGTEVSFTLTAAPAPTSSVTVNVSWTESGTFLTASKPETIAIPTTGTVTLSAATYDDSIDELQGSVTATVDMGSGYTVGTPSSATVTVNDNDVPGRTLTVSGGGTVVTWGDSDGPPTDNSPTRVTADGSFNLAVHRGSSSSCTMRIDPTENPGNLPTVPSGSIRMRTPTTSSFTNYSTTQSVVFDSDSDQVEVSNVNGTSIVLDVSVSC